MQSLFIIANWKAHKTVPETTEWFAQITKQKSHIANQENKTVIICPPFHLGLLVQRMINEDQLNMSSGVQDTSSFPTGAYTGEVVAEQVKEFAEYVILGHSERRKYLHESDELLAQKVTRAHEGGLKVIYCVRGVDDPIPQRITHVAFEPVAAIGSGHPDTPEDANAVAKQIKDKNPQVEFVIYGGSVNGDNVRSFTSQSDISGVLVGTDSLDPQKFLSIIQNS